MTREEQEACEAFFRRNGLPHLMDGYDPREDTLTRLRPALVVILVVGLAIGLRPDWPLGLRALAVGTGLVIAAAAIAIVNVARGRRWSARPERVGFTEATALVLVPPVAALVLGDGLRSALVIGGVSIATAAVLYVLASFGVLPLLIHQAGRALSGAVTTATVAVRAMAVMLALLLFLALSQETWRAFGTLEGWRFGVVMALFGLLSVVLIVSGLRRERAALLAPRPGPELARRASLTPAAPLVRRGVVPAMPPLGRACRAPEHRSGARDLAGVARARGRRRRGHRVPGVRGPHRRPRAHRRVGRRRSDGVSRRGRGRWRRGPAAEAAIRVATLLGGFAAVYFTAVAVGDRGSREEFLGDDISRARVRHGGVGLLARGGFGGARAALTRMRDRVPPPAADGHAMEVTPDTDEVLLPEPGRDVWIEGTEHGPLPVSVLEHVAGGLLGLEPPRIDGVPIRLEEGRRIRVDYRLQGVPCALQAETVAPGARRADRLWIRRLGPTMRFQRRSDFRIRDALTARLWPGRAPPSASRRRSSASPRTSRPPGRSFDPRPGCSPAARRCWSRHAGGGPPGASGRGRPRRRPGTCDR